MTTLENIKALIQMIKIIHGHLKAILQKEEVPTNEQCFHIISKIYKQLGDYDSLNPHYREPFLRLTYQLISHIKFNDDGKYILEVLNNIESHCSDTLFELRSKKQAQIDCFERNLGKYLEGDHLALRRMEAIAGKEETKEVCLKVKRTMRNMLE